MIAGPFGLGWFWVDSVPPSCDELGGYSVPKTGSQKVNLNTYAKPRARNRNRAMESYLSCMYILFVSGIHVRLHLSTFF